MEYVIQKVMSHIRQNDQGPTPLLVSTVASPTVLVNYLGATNENGYF
jgi:hypothetical protein